MSKSFGGAMKNFVGNIKAKIEETSEQPQKSQPAEPSFKQPVTVAPAEKEPQRVPARPAAPVEPPRPAVKSYIAPGTKFKGTLRTQGNVEIAGEFEGDIISEGDVIIKADTKSNIKAVNVAVCGSKVLGDITATGTVNVREEAYVQGNIQARQIVCGGKVEGNLTAAADLALTEHAIVKGNVQTEAISIARGADLQGSVNMNKAAPAQE